MNNGTAADGLNKKEVKVLGQQKSVVSLVHQKVRCILVQK
jgi:hypothetical protein